MPRTTRFGHVEALPSGKWRARCTGPDGARRSKTFAKKTDARVWLSSIETSIALGTWRAADSRRMTIGMYAEGYLERPDLRPSTRELYRTTWRVHLRDQWAEASVGEVTSEQVRSWHAKAAKGTGPTALAIAYRLLRSVLNVAVADGAIAVNPCRVRSASSPRPAKPARTLTAAEVRAVADAVPERYRALVLVLGFGGLRFGEATALQRSDVTSDGQFLRIERSVRYVAKAWAIGPPKTEAGRRTVALPEFVAEAVKAHLAKFVEDRPEGLVFGTRSGRYLARQNFTATFARALTRASVPPTRVHWLRHTGATLAASTGASTRELMHRLGHSSPAAALGYQHAVSERDLEIARALDALGRSER